METTAPISRINTIRWLALAAAAGSLLLGCILAWLVRFGLGAHQSFLPTTARIIDARIEAGTSGKGENFVTFFYGNFTFQYEVNGKPYVAADRGARNSREDGKDDRRDLLAEHPVGSTATVYYDPDDPSRVTFKSSSPGMTDILSYIPLIVGGTAATILVIVALVPKRATLPR